MDIVARGMAAQAALGGPTTSAGVLVGRAKAQALARWFLLRPIGQSVMDIAPTVTTGTASAMTSPFFVPVTSGQGGQDLATTPSNRFTFYRGAPANVAPGNYVPFDNVTLQGGIFGPTGYGFAFFHSGQSLELVFSASNVGYILIKVDDKYVTLTPLQTGTSGVFYAKYDFGSVATRRIDILGGIIYFRGVNISPTDTINPAPIRGPRCIIHVDSFGLSGSSGGTANSFVPRFADLMGWDDVWPSTAAGRGYIAKATGTTPTFGESLARDVVAYKPDIVITVGSLNDWGAGYTVADITAAATAYFSQIKQALPDAVVFAAPNGKGGPATQSVNALDVKDAVKASAIAQGVTYLDLLEQPISFASGAPITGAVLNQYSAGVTGETGIVVSGRPQPFSVIEIGTGTTRERIEVKTFTQVSTGAYRVFFDGTVKFARLAGVPWKQVGPSYMTGHGNAATPTGWGNSDLNIITDGTHPSDAGHRDLAWTLATMMRQAVQ